MCVCMAFAYLQFRARDSLYVLDRAPSLFSQFNRYITVSFGGSTRPNAINFFKCWARHREREKKKKEKRSRQPVGSEHLN